MSGIDGVENARVEAPVEGPALEIEVDLEAAERYGVAPGDVRRTAATLLAGLNVGNLFEQQKIFDVVVWSTPETRSSVTAIQNLAIDAADGSQVRLADVADVRIAPNLAVINRDQVSRYIDVTANTNGAGVKNDIERALDGIQFPQEHRVEVLDNEGRVVVENRGIALAVGAAILIFLLLQLAFGSWRLAGLAFVLVPGALAGGAVAAFADGGNLTIGSYAGFLALLGLSTRHAMALITRLQDRPRGSCENFGPSLALVTAQERVAACLDGDSGYGLGLLPFLFISNSFGHEIVAPMAIVILGGLVSSFAVNLFILPALYLQFATGPEKAPSPCTTHYQSGGGFSVMIDTTTITPRNILTGVITVALLLISAVALLALMGDSASETASGAATKPQPYTVGEKDAETGIASVTLVEKAAERTGIETASVTEAGAVREGSSGTLAVPYSSLWYDAKGGAFVYVVTAPLSYVRAPITVDYVEGDQAILSAGPEAGTEIVTQGVAELYGAESGLK